MATTAQTPSQMQLSARVRQRLVAQTGASLSSLLTKVQERLTQLMDEVAPSREMQVRRDAWMAFQRQKTRWLDGTLSAWESALLADKKAARPSGRVALAADFELQGTDEVENKIIASRMALNLMEKGAEPVNDLRKRLKYLNNNQALSTRDIVHPEVLFFLLVEQWEAAGLSREALQLVSAVVQRHLNEHLEKAYTACNEELIKLGVLPVIEFGAPTSASSFEDEREPHLQVPAPPPAPAPNQQRRASDQPGGANPAEQRRSGGVRIGSPAGRVGGIYGRAQGLMEQVGRLLSGAFLETPPAAGGISGASAYAAQGFVGAERYPGQGVVSGPGGMILPASGAGAVRLAYAGPSAPLMMALAQQPRLQDVQFVTTDGGRQVVYPVAVAQVATELRQLSSELKGKAETDNEKAIIELVALMFQSILQEDRIPPGARVWFARLQMPVLRIALADPDFFSKLDHPARQLIDHMGSCVLGFDSSGISTDALETEIKRVVQVVEQYPETGDRVYRRVYEEFQQFLKKHLAKKPSAQKVMGVAEQLEQKETLAIQYTIELRDQLKDMPVREEIRSFLFKVWTEVLAVSTVRQGKQHEETLLLKKTATDLIWAASAKPNRADRTKVIAGLAALLQNLRDGMSRLGIVRGAQEVHIKIISDTLADAFMAKTETVADAQIQALAKRLAELDDYISDDGGEELPLDTENIEELLGFEASELDVVSEGGETASEDMAEWARELALGSWFALNYKDVTVQVQYVWRSPLGHLHLFSNNVGHSYLFQTVRLAAYLQASLLTPQEDEPLTARATRSALDEIRAHPQRLLG
ncbi:DUF1631 family protein [Rhodoferax fermentans]|uniref:DUF1631 domain-containing protein n=1 Tax=Rhodoferax fermentans TaxID=28066 RepID=A0A1T1ARP4_RHOFE|nr:DUF1631 family protein [Rhodoferax fermentans]MBK1682194.1 DUF1631 domain-containing protein [Rhodoferax fermentans]OOV06782.1 hypothetical protein RF819_08620 [Rhodoferax fermentans]